jgi:Fe-S oxidoreductase
MCPTFMVTRDEGDTTRGRANALRAAIMGDLGPGGLSDPALYDVMDLCLECKACKSECPTGVDMARLKSEFLYQYHRSGGTPLRSRVLGSARGAAAWGSHLAPLSNLVLNSPPGRWFGDRVLGLEGRRPFPAAVRRTFLNWWKARERMRTPGTEARPGQRTVVFFNDTFTNHYDPKQGIAGVLVAERLGQSVSVAPRVCCGRPKISKGFLDAARVQAEATTRALTPIARSGLPIVFWEPGCFSAVRDDHVHLVGDDLKEEARTVSQACMTFEEWLGGTQNLEPGSGPDSLLLHAHCHQKALGGLGAILNVLSGIPKAEVTDADAGCCGMAGSFGYEKEHYEMSRAVGDRKLFPAVRELGPGGLVVAPGFSCRQQIRHFTNAEPVSVMELMEKLTR